ncbi:MAG: hypothetical protein ABI408_01385 [Gemmatimonadaceae bacterium]
MAFLTIVIALAAGAYYMYRRSEVPPKPPPQLTDEQIEQQWRKLGFFCECDNQAKTWTHTGSRAGLLYFPDLLLGHVNDPRYAEDGAREHYGPYGSLEIMTYPEPGFDSHVMRGSLIDFARLAELVEGKLATAEAGSPIKIREEYAHGSPYTLVLDIRPDDFDPASADRAQLGAPIEPRPPKPAKP